MSLDFAFIDTKSLDADLLTSEQAEKLARSCRNAQEEVQNGLSLLGNLLCAIDTDDHSDLVPSIGALTVFLAELSWRLSAAESTTSPEWREAMRALRAEREQRERDKLQPLADTIEAKIKRAASKRRTKRARSRS